MKSIVNRVVVLLLTVAVAGTFVWAKTRKKEVTFTQPVTVDGTVVKKGTYKVEFNEETGELQIKKGDKVVAKAQARLEQTDDRFTTYSRSDPKDPTKLPELISVSLRKGSQATIISSVAATK
jgi:hypothetical protein